MTERTLRAVIVLLGLYHLALGLFALLAPGTFFAEIGRAGLGAGSRQLAPGISPRAGVSVRSAVGG